MLFRLLGPLEVVCAGSPVPLGGPRQRALLTALLFRANRLATVAYLTESVWETPPAAPESNLRTYVAGLRRRLPEMGSRLLTMDGGYLLRVLPGESDLATFDELVSTLPDTADQDLLDRLDQALTLWRGRPMEGLVPGPLLASAATRLVDLRIDIAQRFARTAAALGRDHDVACRLRGLAEQYPLREELWEHLIGALQRCGREAEALSAYERAREHLARELGVEPGTRLRQVRQRVVAARRGAFATTRQLPMDIPEFTGREVELDLLDTLTEDRAVGPLVVSIEGMAGIGKTRFAVHAAHRLVHRGRCRTVQLWADLHGFDRRRPPTDPAEVLDGFLRAIGVPGQQIPVDVDVRAAMFRDRLAGEDALVVLDNAATADQVRPLLPGDAGAVTLITSRRSLAWLDGATPLRLAVFEPGKSLALQAKIVGADRIAAEPEAAARVAARCGHLPLALSLAARQLRRRPTWSVADLAGCLDGGVDQVDSDQSVRTTFDISYRSLPAERARVFRLLALHPGRAYTCESTAAVAGIPLDSARKALEHLLDEHLLSQVGAGRYALHDLVLSYAVGRTESDDSRQNRTDSVRRVLEWFLDAVIASARRIEPHRKITLTGRRPVKGVPAFTDHDSALAWCEVERTTLVDAVRLAADTGLHTIAWRLSEALVGFFRLRSHWADWAATHQIALTAAEQAGDLHGQTTLLRSLGSLHGDLLRHDRAIETYRRTQRILTELGDRRGTARPHATLGRVLLAGGHPDAALVHEVLADQSTSPCTDPAQHDR